MWRYIQSNGHLFSPEGSLFVVGYSGRANDGKNIPAKEREKGIGPIPRGRWTIGPPYKGPTDFSLRLTPTSSTNTFGRSAFLIHGDNKSQTASQGCIIVSPRKLRETIWASNDRDLLVVRDPDEFQASLLTSVPQVLFTGKPHQSVQPAKSIGRVGPGKRRFDARPDTLDFRDRMFVPTLVEVPRAWPLEEYLRIYRRKTRRVVPILDQGQEGACTGFGLAAVCNYLLGHRSGRSERVSERMLYEMARRYDEWPGEDYDGSSARGAMKGWHQHGVCAARLWPYAPQISTNEDITNARAADASARPLGAYFRVNHKDLVAMHAALAEVGILYATAAVHDGWDNVRKDGLIPYVREQDGGHAFAIVGYNETGFWIQNSWGTSWGKRGFALLSYEDWLENGFDVWVARLGVPIKVEGVRNLGVKQGGVQTASFSFHELRRHIIRVGNEGGFKNGGTFGTTAADVQELFAKTIPELTKNWKQPRLLIYAHGGLVSEENAVQRIQDYLEPLLDAEVYPVAFVWRTDFWNTIRNILKDSFVKDRGEEPVGSAKDFLLDRTDDTLERVARLAGGKEIWGEMKENGVLSTMAADGAARAVAIAAASFLGSPAGKNWELHLAGHSAGSIFLAPFCRLMTGKGALDAEELRRQTGQRWEAATGLAQTVKTCSLWAPACTTYLFQETYGRALDDKAIDKLAIYNLSDATEQDDNCARIYNKSLLYLVSNALETTSRRLFSKHGHSILGLDKIVRRDLAGLPAHPKVEYVLAPNSLPKGDVGGSGATQHGAFDDDPATVQGTLSRILGKASTKSGFSFERSAQSTTEKREELWLRLKANGS